MSRWFPEPTLLWLRPQKAQLSLDAFEGELDRMALRRGARLTCVVAGEGVRYRIVPWSDELSSPQQRQVFVRHCFTETFGEAAHDWTVRAHPTHHGAATLACAIDTTVLDRLGALAQARHLSLVSVQPSLTHAYNQLRRHIEASLFWFVWIDGPWTTLLLVSQREPLHVKRVPSGSGELAHLLDREWFLIGTEEPRCPVYVARGASAEPVPVRASAADAGSSWQVVDLPCVPDRMETLQ